MTGYSEEIHAPAHSASRTAPFKPRLFPLFPPLLLMLLWLLALIRNYFSRGRRRCCAARQPPGFFAFIEPIFLLSHPVHSPTVFASYSNRDEAHISGLRATNQN